MVFNGQGTGDFGEDLGLNRDADDVGDGIEHFAQRGYLFVRLMCRIQLVGVQLAGVVAAGAELA